MNYLGIDYGEVNYGFAIGNSITKNSTTYFSEKIASEQEALKFIESLIKEWDLKGIILKPTSCFAEILGWLPGVGLRYFSTARCETI